MRSKKGHRREGHIIMCPIIFKRCTERFPKEHTQLFLKERSNTEWVPTVQQEYGKAAMLMLFALRLIQAIHAVYCSVDITNTWWEADTNGANTKRPNRKQTKQSVYDLNALLDQFESQSLNTKSSAHQWKKSYHLYRDRSS